MLDLYNNKYDRQTLKDNIYAVKLIDILKTQTLDVTFIVRYILNTKYQLHDEDQIITPELVLKYQPHISLKNLIKEITYYNSDDDSVDDFETVSNRDK
jgi:hypothetical protein